MIASKKSRKSYSLALKKEALEYLDKNDNNIAKTAHKYEVGRNQIRNQFKQRNLIENDDRKYKRVKRRIVKPRKGKYKEEKLIYDQIRELRSNNLNISYRDVRAKCEEIIQDPLFKASNGYIFKFLKRWDLSM